jgi:uncharacterized protein with ACT and thioredoxin-like domain
MIVKECTQDNELVKVKNKYRKRIILIGGGFKFKGVTIN